jgi:hypothetical protein
MDDEEISTHKFNIQDDKRGVGGTLQTTTYKNGGVFISEASTA